MAINNFVVVFLWFFIAFPENMAISVRIHLLLLDLSFSQGANKKVGKEKLPQPVLSKLNFEQRLKNFAESPLEKKHY